MNSESPDDELVAIAKKKIPSSTKAYGFLVVRHEPWVFRMLKNLLRTSEAEEVKQDTFFSGWTQIRKLTENAKFRGWIRTIAVNRAYKKHRRHQIERDYQEASEVFADTEASDTNYEETEAVRNVLYEIEYSHREILVLRYVEELSIGEIAETLGLGESAAKMRLKRARDLFKVHYEEATRG